MEKLKGIAVDADFAIFECTQSSFAKTGGFKKSEDGNVNGNYKEPLGMYKKRFKAIINDIHDEVVVELLGKYKVGKKVVVLLSDPDTNFRYDLYPEYKGNRKSDRTELFYRLRKWALKKYGYVKNIEADDQCSYYSKKGYVICSIDKDVLKGIPGVHFDVYHSRRSFHTTTEHEARMFNLIQTLTGDPTDNIKGIPGVAEKTAIKLLDKHGWTWDGVLKAYEEKGLTKEDMVLNARLILMDQWSPKKGLSLFSYN